MKKIREADFQVFKKESQRELGADIEGVTRLDRLVLVDQKDGKEGLYRAFRQRRQERFQDIEGI